MSCHTGTRNNYFSAIFLSILGKIIHFFWHSVCRNNVLIITNTKLI